MKRSTLSLFSGLVAVLFSTLACAQVDSALQAKIDHEIEAAKVLAADPAIVAAVQAHNAAPSGDAAAMTQEKWKTLTLLDPFVRGFSKNPAGEALKAKKSAFVSEAFVSGAEGTKVAFLAKPSSWSHRGKAKHDVPMSGKVWQGEIEVDESTGLQQVQVAVPVLDGTTPIGSLVMGLSVTKLRN
ncbi:MAG TPA: hypothetical protein VK163_16115 [Opitutaceae bacterium]|nr:hypothetical protein [Opitutaceae bacterium]